MPSYHSPASPLFFPFVCAPACAHLLCLLCDAASDVRIVEGLLSGSLDQELNGVTMTPDTSTSTPAASSVSPSSPAARLSISLDLLHVVSSPLSPSPFSASLGFPIQPFI